MFTKRIGIDLGTPVERLPFPKLTASRHGVASTGQAANTAYDGLY